MRHDNGSLDVLRLITHDATLKTVSSGSLTWVNRRIRDQLSKAGCPGCGAHIVEHFDYLPVGEISRAAKNRVERHVFDCGVSIDRRAHEWWVAEGGCLSPITLTRKFERLVLSKIEARGSRGGRRNISMKSRFEVLKRSDFRCVYCKSDDAPLVIDHRVPVAAGGENNLDNLVAACVPCNAGKSDQPLQ